MTDWLDELVSKTKVTSAIKKNARVLVVDQLVRGVGYSRTADGYSASAVVRSKNRARAEHQVKIDFKRIDSQTCVSERRCTCQSGWSANQLGAVRPVSRTARARNRDQICAHACAVIYGVQALVEEWTDFPKLHVNVARQRKNFVQPRTGRVQLVNLLADHFPKYEWSDVLKALKNDRYSFQPAGNAHAAVGLRKSEAF